MNKLGSALDVDPDQERPLPERRPTVSGDEENLLYVALTRAKKSLVMMGTLVAVLEACGVSILF